MNSEGALPAVSLNQRIKTFLGERWSELPDRQKVYAKKAWSVLTYKWRWQIAMNIPYLAIFVLDRSIPAVHDFDMNLLAAITAKLPIPAFVSAWIG